MPLFTAKIAVIAYGEAKNPAKFISLIAGQAKTKTKMINSIETSADRFVFGWKSYNSIKKKAMEQEFSMAGLGLSLSIAFFIVISSALALNSIYLSLEKSQNRAKVIEQKVYHLENASHLNPDSLDYFSKFFGVKPANACVFQTFNVEKHFSSGE